MRTTSLLTAAVSAAIASLSLAPESSAQSRYLFSIDWQSPSVGTTTSSGDTITEGDILRPDTGTSLPDLTVSSGPEIQINHTSDLFLPPFCIGHPGGTPCIVEVDAFSMGSDEYFRQNWEILPGQIAFSVDEYGGGNFTNPFPSIDTEFPVGDSSADTFLNGDYAAPGPLAPIPGRHIGMADGDAAPSGSGALYPGIGLIEPNNPAPGPVDAGDNLDALDIVEPIATVGGRPYFSLDSQFMDPLEGVPNSGSALANGFFGGDVLTVDSTGAIVVYAPSFLLGLNFSGADDDDLDALILRENGIPGYQISSNPYDWTPPGGRDMLIFSVRRGSSIIGAPDSIFGLPIEEGDLLVPPIPGGVSPFPGIFIAAEFLGLGTVRSGTSIIGSDLNAADSLRGPILDCDGDGVEDSIAIMMGLVPDANGDGVPDSCTTIITIGPIGTPSCFCPFPVAPCGNASPTTGCLNSVGSGALLTGFGPQIAGASVVSPDNLILTTSGMPGPTFALMFYGSAMIPPVPLGNGLRCIGGPLFRLPPILFVPASGTVSYGPGVISGSTINGVFGTITTGSTWTFQTWYREWGLGPCGTGSNTSSALTVTFI